MCINCTGNNKIAKPKKGRRDWVRHGRQGRWLKKWMKLQSGENKARRGWAEKRWWRCAFCRWISNRCHCNDVLLGRCSFHIIAFVRKLSNNLSFFKRQLLNILSENKLFKLLSHSECADTHTHIRTVHTDKEIRRNVYIHATCTHSSGVYQRIVCVT